MEISSASAFRGDRWSRLLTGRRVVVYLRISSDPEDERRGVTRQEQDAEEVVRGGGGVLVWTAVENDTSAFQKKRVRVSDGEGGYRWAWRVIRPLWERALRMIRDGEGDCLLVVDLDRLTREPRDLEDTIELVEHYRALVLDVSGALDLSTDHGIFLARMMVAHANLSSRDTSRRIRRAKRADAEAGRPRTGWRAFGYAADGRTVVEDEAALIREAYERMLAGVSGYAMLADWNRRGVLTTRGNPWKYQTLRCVLTNPRNAGLVSMFKPSAAEGSGCATADEYGRWAVRCDADGTEAVGTWPAIVERADWEAVCARFTETARRAGAGTARNTRRYLLSGLLRCGLCGSRMQGGAYSADYVLYRCRGRFNGSCRGVSGQSGPLEEYITEAALAKYEAEVAGWEQAGDDPQAEWSGAAQLELVERKLSEAYQHWKADRLDGGAYFTMRADLEADRARLGREYAAWARTRAETAQPTGGPVDVRAAWCTPAEEGGWTLQAKREFLSRQLVAVQYLPAVDPVTGRRPRGVFDPASLTLIWRDPATGPDDAASTSGPGAARKASRA